MLLLTQALPPPPPHCLQCQRCFLCGPREWGGAWDLCFPGITLWCRSQRGSQVHGLFSRLCEALTPLCSLLACHPLHQGVTLLCTQTHRVVRRLTGFQGSAPQIWAPLWAPVSPGFTRRGSQVSWLPSFGVFSEGVSMIGCYLESRLRSTGSRRDARPLSDLSPGRRSSS